jgi:hypothetical protein
LSYFWFSIFVEAELLNCINCNPVPRGTKEPFLTMRFEQRHHFGPTRGLQLDLEIALSGVSAKVQPLRLIQPCRRQVETSDDVIKEAFTIIAAICRALFYAPDGVRLHEPSNHQLAVLDGFGLVRAIAGLL